MAKIKVKGTEITVYSHIEEDYICITDIARHKNAERTDDLIRNWIRNRNTIEFLRHLGNSSIIRILNPSNSTGLKNRPVSIALPLRLSSGLSKPMRSVLFQNGADMAAPMRIKTSPLNLLPGFRWNSNSI